MLQLKSLNVEENTKFWETPPSNDYKADVVARVILQICSSYVGRVALDVGAANGSLMGVFTMLFPDRAITGIDVAPKSPKVLKASSTDMPFGDQSFDTVFWTDVIEHYNNSDLDRTLSEINRVLTPGGRLIASTINKENLEQSVVTCPHFFARFHMMGHCQVFSDERIRIEFPKKGFEPIKLVETNLGALAKYGWIARLAYKIGLDRIVKSKPWHIDLIIVAQKIPNQ